MCLDIILTGSTLTALGGGVYRGQMGNLRELVFGVLRKHRDDNISDYLQLRFVRRCDIDEHISSLHADF